ncbi:CDP-glycerol glycerophosphotransferase family protein [Catellatospora paridis]|uniref:CDP-glycerol glycerophosphotransferase family protein n=1 Tax=Catellatospora paridis TaxID=1617086 RepID=UPI0012D4AE74|nr:CDP-glycerol glycerophosphotransferase family protein [Catellatospora paridis]
MLRRIRSISAKARRVTRQPSRALKYALYRAQLRLPLDEHLAVYSAYWNAAYSCNPAAIYEKARELAPHIRGVWVVKADRVANIPAGVDYVIEESPAYFRAMARAKYFISNANFPEYIVKRPGSVVVLTHHGTPLKLMGMDGLTFAGRDGTGSAELRRLVARWDYSIAANPFSTEAWRTAFPGGYESLEYGYPRNDVLVSATPEHGVRVRAELGIEPGKRVILYAPTHRGSTPGARSSYLDAAALAESLGPDTVILARSHYFYEDRPSAAAGAARVVDVTTHPRVEDLYLAADVLITDYSSTMFDFAVLDRPIAVYAADWSYYRRSRGAYFDIAEAHPGVIATTQDELVALFASGAVDGPDARQRRAAFRERFCALEDGRASERVVRRVLLGEQVDHRPTTASRVPQQATRADRPAATAQQPALS